MTTDHDHDHDDDCEQEEEEQEEEDDEDTSPRRLHEEGKDALKALARVTAADFPKRLQTPCLLE